MQVARFICISSLALSLFWVLGLLAEGLLKSEANLFLLGGFSFLFGVLTWWRLYKSSSHFLATQISKRVLVLYAASIVIAYMLTLPLGAAVGIAYIRLSHGYFPAIEGELSVLVGLSAIWLPLWWSPAVGITAGWFVYSRRQSGRL